MAVIGLTRTLAAEVGRYNITVNAICGSRAVTAAALACGQQVVFERLASDAAVPARTVREYFQVTGFLAALWDGEILDERAR